jgi:hypothetical protein
MRLFLSFDCTLEALRVERRLSNVASQNLMDVGRVSRHVTGPCGKSAVAVDRPYPFREKLPLCLLFLIRPLTSRLTARFQPPPFTTAADNIKKNH